MTQSYADMALQAHREGRQAQALEFIAQAMHENPHDDVYKQHFIDIVGPLRIKLFNPTLKALVTLCLQTPDLGHEGLFRFWWSLLMLDPDFRPLYKTATCKDYAAFKKAFLKLKTHDALWDPFFLSGLKVFCVPDIVFERFIGYLRQSVLDSLESEERDEYLELVSALAVYCYNTQYVLYIGEEESLRIEALRAVVESDGDLFDILAYACYAPLHGLANATEIAEHFAAEDVVQEQLLDYWDEQEIKTHIEQLTPIEDDVSQEVRGQYEGFPYPRWKSLSAHIALDGFRAFLGEERTARLERDGAQILIAGCGTGQQALEYGLAFPRAEILAIDLSQSSLAYAIRNAQGRGVDNVRFKQADILRLGALEERFDLIVSTGVLHHMDDPAVGWAVLNGLLKPGGLMRIGLYSERARWFIVEGRGVIEQRGYGRDADSVRRFRHDCPELFKKKTLEAFYGSSDFYYLAECQDMLFHVCEHRYDLVQIADLLEDMGMSFVKFEMPEAVRVTYRKMFPDDPALVNLQNWDRFEQKNPDTFINMFRFWCEKPG